MSNTELKLYTLPDPLQSLTTQDVQNAVNSRFLVQNVGQQKLSGGSYQSANFVSSTSGWQLTPTSAEFNVGVAVTSINIPNSTTANSFHTDASGNSWWGTNVATGYTTAPAYILSTGAARFTSIEISGVLNSANTDISLLDLTHNIVFTSSNLNTVTWAAGTITLSNGRTFSISSGTTGAIAAQTYIYLDTGVSSTVLQTTTTVATAMGANKKLIATAKNQTSQATFTVFEGIGGMKLIPSQTNISNNNWAYSGTWTVTDADTISWGAGTLTTSDGGSYSISAGNTGNMAAKTFVYFSLGSSSTIFSTTTTAATAVGDGKILIAICQNGTAEASFMVVNDKQINIDAANIVAGSITANEIATGTITAAKLTVSQLSAIAADMGTITAGTVTGATIRTAASGARFSMDSTSFTGINSTGITVFELVISGTDAGDVTMGNTASTRYAKWDDSAGTFTVNGYVQSSKGAFGGDGSDGVLSVSSGITTINLGGAQVVTKNYTTISITGTGKIAFSNPHANGTIIIFKSQGNVTITSSGTPAIDLRSLGSSANDSANLYPYATSTNGKTGGATAVADGPNSAGAAGSLNTPFLLNAVGFPLSCGGGGAEGNVSDGGTAKGNGGSGGASVTTNGTAAVTGAVGVNNNTSRGTGGRGAGCLYLECAGSYTCSSTINASGADGTSPTGTGANGGGGGGGGGEIFILYNILVSNTGTYTVTGGTGAAPTAAGTTGGNGATGASYIGVNTLFA